MKIGEPFNPRAKDLGFFPAEIVDKRRDLTNGQKLLYHRMVGWARLEDGERHNERAGEVWRSHETIADDLGKCERQIRRDLEALETAGLLDRRKRDGRKSNTYFFLFHPSFDRTSESAQTASAPKECPVATGRPCPPKFDLSGRPSPANHKAFNHKLESSWSEDSGQWKEQEAKPATAETTSTTAPPELAELLPDWLDAEAQRRIWEGCRRFAPDCRPEEVREAVQDKIRVLGKKTNPGLVITSVPKMFEGSRGFHHRLRQHAHQQAVEQERRRQELERLADDGGQATETRGRANQRPRDADPMADTTAVALTGTTGQECGQGAAKNVRPTMSALESAAAEGCRLCGTDGIVNGSPDPGYCDCERGRAAKVKDRGYLATLKRIAAKQGASWILPERRQLAKNLRFANTSNDGPPPLVFQGGMPVAGDTISARSGAPDKGTQRFESEACIDPHPPHAELGLPYQAAATGGA